MLAGIGTTATTSTNSRADNPVSPTSSISPGVTTATATADGFNIHVHTISRHGKSAIGSVILVAPAVPLGMHMAHPAQHEECEQECRAKCVQRAAFAVAACK